MNKDEPETRKNLTLNSSGVAENVLRGEVVRAIFENEENGYSVIVVRDDRGVEHTLTGSLSDAFQGQVVEARGVWETHPGHGRQFKVREHKILLPITIDGIRRYLASGVLPGVGGKTAQAIVDRFGLQTLEILERYSPRLKEIPGLGAKKIRAIKEAWDKEAARRSVYVCLQGFGVSKAYCDRIYKVFGDSSAEVVRENPFRLAEHVDGIGFVLADKIAGSVGFKKDDEKRIKSGILYSLVQLRAEGHTRFPEIEFRDYAASLLEAPPERVAESMQKLAREGKIVIEDSCVYDQEMHSAETELPLLLSKLNRAEKFSGSKMAGVGLPFSKELCEEQARAVEAAARSPVSIITGGPGVGKTTVVSEIVRRASAAKLKVMLAAPTGRAAKRLSESTGERASTIHRLLQWVPEKRGFLHGPSSPLRCDLLIVDEVSMLDLPLAVSLFRAVKPGCCVVLVGDSDQLPSVGPGKVLSDLIESGLFPVTRLRRIFRQGEGSRIIFTAHEVNDGRIPNPPSVPRDEVSDFYMIEQEEPEQVLRIIRTLVCERIPARFGLDPFTDIQVLSPMNRGSCGTVALNEMLQESLNSAGSPQFRNGDRVFKVGDKVMQISNNYDKNVFNGDMGRIAGVDIEDKSFIVLFDSVPVRYEFAEADQIVLSYAATVHKSQGCEFPAVVFPLLTQHFMMLQRNLLYTGMTRARKLLVLIGSKKALAMAVKNFVAAPRHSGLLDRLKKTLGG